MSPSTKPSDFALLTRALPSVSRRLGDDATQSLRAVSFYAAIALPMVYLPLVAGGLTPGNVPVVTALLAANAVALVAGHGHGIEE